MSWKIYPIDCFSALANDWDGLQARAGGVPFLESRFILPLLKEFGDGRELIAVFQAGPEITAAMILVRGRLGMWRTFQPSQLPLGACLFGSAADCVSIVRSLIRALPGLALGAGITQLDPQLRSRPESAAIVDTQDYIQTAWVEVNGSFDAYWEARGKNLKQNLRKQRNKLDAEGVKVELECITSACDVAEAIQDFGTLESAGWKAGSGTAVHLGNAQGRFYRTMLETFCDAGRAKIYRYRFGDRIVAMDLCIMSDAMLVILKTTYDESYKTLSPAFLMRQDQFRRLFEDNENRISCIEFYGKVMEWHTRWTENARTLYHLTVYRWPVLRSLHDRLKRMRVSRALPPPVVKGTLPS